MIKRSLYTALCLIVSLAMATAPAWAVSLEDVTRTLETPFQAATAEKYRISDYSADFLQESKIASLDRLQRANGRVEVAFDYSGEQAAPQVRFRWHYEQPTTQEIVSDGRTLWVYLPENNQVIQSEIEQVNEARENDPMAFLTGLGNLSRDFQISQATPDRDSDGNYALELTPRQASALINRLVIVVDQAAVAAYHKRGKQDCNLRFPIKSTTVYDPNGNSTLIEFSNLRVNHGLLAESFDFKLPAGAQVVSPTGKDLGL